jgi:hypothetical protein
VVSFPQVFPPKPCMHLSSTPPPIRPTYPTHLFLLDVIIWIIFGDDHSSFTFLLSEATWAQMFSSASILKHPQPAFLPQHEQPSFMPIKKKKKNYSTDNIFEFHTGRQKILHWMIASIPWLQFAFNCFMNQVWICYGSFQIFEVLHPLKGFITSLYVLIFPTFWGSWILCDVLSFLFSYSYKYVNVFRFFK